MAEPATAVPIVVAKEATAAVPNPFGGVGQMPIMNNGMTFKEIGNSGLRAFSGYVREEFLYQLQGRQGATVYREMADNSPVIGAIIFAIQSTMRKVEWRCVSVDDTPAAQEMADFADSLRDDMSHTWQESVMEDLSMLTYGYAPKEIVYKRRLGQKPGGDRPRSNYDDGRIGWRKLPLRGQDTVIRWFFDPNGETMGMTQQPWVGPLIDIPIEKMLLFRPTQMKNNPEGRSILRNAYRPYYFSKRTEEQEAILFERMNGVPVIKVPTSLLERVKIGDPDAVSALNTFKAMAVNLRIDEQMGIIMPSDTFMGATGPSSVPQYSLELVAPGGTGGRAPVTANETLTRYATQMLMSVLADFIMLGHDQHGTQALGVSKVDMFFQAIEGFLNANAAVYNRHGLRRIWDLNGLDPELMPEFEPDLAQRVDLDVLGSFVQKLAAAGMAIFPSPGGEMESALLDAAGLPAIEDPDAMEALMDQVPMPIVGPAAALLMPKPDPVPGNGEDGPPPKKGSPADKFQKMVMAGIAKRMLRMAGPSMPIGTGKMAKRRAAQAAQAVAKRQRARLPRQTELPL